MELFEETGVFIAGWDSFAICKHIDNLRETINMGNDDEFETIMQLAITERNKVMISVIEAAMKRSFDRIVVVMGSAHYDEITSQYCRQSNVPFVWIG